MRCLGREDHLRCQRQEIHVLLDETSAKTASLEARAVVESDITRSPPNPFIHSLPRLQVLSFQFTLGNRPQQQGGRKGWNIRGSFHHTITTGREDETGVPWAVLAHSDR